MHVNHFYPSNIRFFCFNNKNDTSAPLQVNPRAINQKRKKKMICYNERFYYILLLLRLRLFPRDFCYNTIVRFFLAFIFPNETEKQRSFLLLNKELRATLINYVVDSLVNCVRQLQFLKSRS